VHWYPHWLATQAACACATLVVHGAPQPPQFCASFVVFTQVVVPQSVGADALQLATQALDEPELEQMGAVVPHALPQAPQWLAVAMLVSQPSSGLAVQWLKPALQALASKVQTPLTQVTVPPTFARFVQSWPHAPQLRGSSGTHAPPQRRYVASHEGAAIASGAPSGVVDPPASAPGAPTSIVASGVPASREVTAAASSFEPASEPPDGTAGKSPTHPETTLHTPTAVARNPTRLAFAGQNIGVVLPEMAAVPVPRPGDLTIRASPRPATHTVDMAFADVSPREPLTAGANASYHPRGSP
jgi:hypothetical protein